MFFAKKQNKPVSCPINSIDYYGYQAGSTSTAQGKSMHKALLLTNWPEAQTKPKGSNSEDSKFYTLLISQQSTFSLF